MLGGLVCSCRSEPLKRASPADNPEKDPSEPKRLGRRKIKIKFIEDKIKRHTTFSKRKAGIMKKAHELSILTGTQILLLVTSETGQVYTFATPKLQPLVTDPEGRGLIKACLDRSEPVGAGPEPRTNDPYYSACFPDLTNRAQCMDDHPYLDPGIWTQGFGFQSESDPTFPMKHPSSNSANISGL